MKNLKVFISLQDCKHNWLYLIDARNAHLGIFNKHTKGFIILRTKGRARYLFTEYHWNNGEPFGTVKPLEEIEDSKFEITENFKEFSPDDKELYEKVFRYLDRKNTKKLQKKFEKYIV